MKEQVEFCETTVAELARLFPHCPPDWFTTNAASSKLGHLLTIAMPASVARLLIDTYVKSLP